MKRRLESAPPTREDRLIWLRINLPLFRAYKVRPLPWHLYQDADRRDADLMLGLTGREPCGSEGTCIAELWLCGCVIYNPVTDQRIAITPQYYQPKMDGTMYFA